MPQKKRLNGLPHNLIKSYFATDKYCVCGYMSDWLWNAAKELKIHEVTIDIINKNHNPSELNIHPFTYELPFLKAIIERTLTQNGFNKDFIIEAKIKVELVMDLKQLYCYSWLVDSENNTYSVGPLIEFSLCEEFNPFDL